MHPTQKPPTRTQGDTRAQVLRDAALYLQRHGWHQGDFYATTTNTATPTPPACTDGAVRCALFGGPTTAISQDQLRALERVLGVLAGYIHQFVYDNPDRPVDPPHLIVSDWNDDDARTADDVITTLREAADNWDRIHRGAR
jgi:hypothetical protein